ncbi:MAG: lysylphosphatidylglycerol synthase transmembrane domain-containing protein [Caldilineaceae bacterium]
MSENQRTRSTSRNAGLRQSLQFIVGIVISAVFVTISLRGLHLSEVLESLRTANYWWIIPGVIVYFIGLWARTWRWHYTLRHLKSIPLQRLYPLICIGYFGNNVFPFRAGEVLRSYVLKQREDVPISASLATVFIERIFDGLVMLLFVFVALPFAPLPVFYRNSVIVLTLLLFAATAVFVWMAVQPTRVEIFYRWLADRILPAGVREKTDGIYQKFMSGLKSLSSGSDVLMIFVTSIAVWLMETVKYWFVMHAFSFSVSFLVLMLMNGLVNLATTLPSAPGYVGTFDAPGIGVLTAFGIDRAVATSYTLTLHAALWLPVTLVGAWYFWRGHLRIREVVEQTS